MCHHCVAGRVLQHYAKKFVIQEVFNGLFVLRMGPLCCWERISVLHDGSCVTRSVWDIICVT